MVVGMGRDSVALPRMLKERLLYVFPAPGLRRRGRAWPCTGFADTSFCREYIHGVREPGSLPAPKLNSRGTQNRVKTCLPDFSGLL